MIQKQQTNKNKQISKIESRDSKKNTKKLTNDTKNIQIKRLQ